MLSSRLRLGFRSGLFLLRFVTKILHAFLICPMLLEYPCKRDKYRGHILLDPHSIVVNQKIPLQRVSQCVYNANLYA